MRSHDNVRWVISITIKLFFRLSNREEVLKSKQIDTKNFKEQKDIFILTHSLTKDGLYLVLDGYRVEEENQVEYILETYKENKALKLKVDLDDLFRCGEKYVCGAVFVIGTSILLLELPTLPFRTMSVTKERIQKEIKTIPNENIPQYNECLDKTKHCFQITRHVNW